jgi:hypothetical protein
LKFVNIHSLIARKAKPETNESASESPLSQREVAYAALRTRSIALTISLT